MERDVPKRMQPLPGSLRPAEGVHALIAYLFIDSTETDLTDLRALRAPLL